MHVTMSSFKIKLSKALATTNTPPSSPPKKNNVEVQLDHFWPWLNNFNQDGERGGAIAVPNPQDKISVSKEVQNC